jgi:raffinose/stachyose/melibiose transport system permease protein
MMRTVSISKISTQVIKYGFLLTYLVIAVFPLIWLFYNSLKTMPEIMNSTFTLPQSFNLENYVEIWTGGSFPRYYLNSIIVSIVSVAGIVVLSTMSGYVFSRIRFRMREVLFYFFLAGMMIPVQVTLIPNFVMLRNLGQLDSYQAMILPYISFGLPVSIYIMRTFFEELPLELEDAARIDGCSTSGIFWRVMLPLARPAVATIIIYNFLAVWNELIFALTFINDAKYRTIPLGLMDFVGQYEVNLAFTFAALISAMLPLLIVYFFAQRQIISGLAAGAVKG